MKNLTGSSRLLFVDLIRSSFGPGLVVLPDADAAEALAEEAQAVFGEEEVAFFPVFEDRNVPITLNPRQAGMRMEVLRDLLGEKLTLVITSGSGLFQRLPDPEWLCRTRLHLGPGKEFDLAHLIEKMVDFGYVRETMVERPGEFSVRGGILDIFPYTGEPPHRLEFFGNTLESMRTFHIDTQRSIKTVEQLTLIASPDAEYSAGKILIDYFKNMPWIFIEDWEKIRSGKNPDQDKAGIIDTVASMENRLRNLRIIHHHTLTSPHEGLLLDVHPIPPMGRFPSSIRNQISTWSDHQQKVYLFCDSPRQTGQMIDFLDLKENPVSGCHVVSGPLRYGFRIPDRSLIVLTQSEIFGRFHHYRPRKRFRIAGKPIREMTALSKGDFVVHIDHGIGVYQGLQRITVADSERECIAIRYKDEDMLYVPVDKMERVQKYAGRQSSIPELNKLGNNVWEKTKSRTKKSVEKIARELITLYSARQSRPGYAFSQDTVWQNELEAAFVYEETPDQLRAIRDVKKDMEKPVPMDRLICGDVGYGKTEVAVRAAFKAVNDGKQVALLVPTTVLAQQHYQTFLERLSGFPVQIEMLSRFRSKNAQSEIVQRLNMGTLDIVIGTHRLLSKDVEFKDLGLVIIDEEQKFGVRHKERLKSLRETVDVMALSATPIPRTLNLSLVNIRDMSLINTPPRDRLSIHTEVMPFDEAIVEEAIHRELDRQGQIFFVHNRIQSIHTVARMIERIVPGIRLAIAHGQMNERVLEKIMVDFVEHQYDCLVATMIVGSGLDMPHVNTLLVNRADRLGLSQLYQLRGRVGRSNKKAYAYLFTPPLQGLKPEAVKRLRTIEEFTELGAGFQIAMRDLEIRGAGNLLGYQQSGYMDAVGFELYTRLVAEAVEELKTQEFREPTPKTHYPFCQAQIDEDAYFPDDYIPDESIRVNLYKRLSNMASEEDLRLFSDEMRDRFGPLPQSAENLLGLFDLQIFGGRKYIRQIRIENDKLRIFFDPLLAEILDNSETLSCFLHRITDSSSVPVRFFTHHGLGLELDIPESDRLSFTKKWLQSWG
ncbi:transcription-repair coupling factor [bacterium]|nr:transcription-repair coupling factor [bacterium]